MQFFLRVAECQKFDTDIYRSNRSQSCYAVLPPPAPPPPAAARATPLRRCPKVHQPSFFWPHCLISQVNRSQVNRCQVMIWSKENTQVGYYCWQSSLAFAANFCQWDPFKGNSKHVQTRSWPQQGKPQNDCWRPQHRCCVLYRNANSAKPTQLHCIKQIKQIFLCKEAFNHKIIISCAALAFANQLVHEFRDNMVASKSQEIPFWSCL